MDKLEHWKNKIELLCGPDISANFPSIQFTSNCRYHLTGCNRAEYRIPICCRHFMDFVLYNRSKWPGISPSGDNFLRHFSVKEDLLMCRTFHPLDVHNVTIENVNYYMERQPTTTRLRLLRRMRTFDAEAQTSAWSLMKTADVFVWTTSWRSTIRSQPQMKTEHLHHMSLRNMRKILKTVAEGAKRSSSRLKNHLAQNACSLTADRLIVLILRKQ